MEEAPLGTFERGADGVWGEEGGVGRHGGVGAPRGGRPGGGGGPGGRRALNNPLKGARDRVGWEYVWRERMLQLVFKIFCFS